MQRINFSFAQIASDRLFASTMAMNRSFWPFPINGLHESADDDSTIYESANSTFGNYVSDNAVYHTIGGSLQSGWPSTTDPTRINDSIVDVTAYSFHPEIPSRSSSIAGYSENTDYSTWEFLHDNCMTTPSSTPLSHDSFGCNQQTSRVSDFHQNQYQNPSQVAIDPYQASFESIQHSETPLSCVSTPFPQEGGSIYGISVRQIDVSPTYRLAEHGAFTNDGYNCTDCGKTFTEKKNCTRHIKDVHSPKSTACALCKHDMREDNIPGHYKYKHPNQNCRCVHHPCRKLFCLRTGSSIPTCRNQHANHVCGICGKAFGTVDNLRRHQMFTGHN